MKLSLSISAVNGYSTSYSKSISVEIEDHNCIDDVMIGLSKLSGLAKETDFIEPDINRGAEIFMAHELKKAKDEGIKEGKSDCVVSTDQWKLQAEVTDLKRELKQMACQRDGLIKAVNPDFVPNPDGVEPQELM